MMGKVNLPAPSDELAGFVVFRPGLHRTDDIAITVRKTYVRLSDRAMIELGNPDHVTVLIDYNRKRLMVMPSEAKNENTIKVGLIAKTQKRCILSAEGLRKEILMVTGDEDPFMKCFPGHKAQTKTTALIFDLAEEK